MATKEKALAVTGETGFAIVDTSEAGEVMMGAFDQLGISNFQLNRIKIPAGGGTAWEVDTLEGTDVFSDLDVIVLAVKGKQKSWWANTIDAGGGGIPPTCSSTDGRIGIGNNTVDPEATPGEHKCIECAWNQFGSSRIPGSGAKDCKDFSLMFVFTEGSRLPSLMTVPATSLKALQGYILKLIDAGKRMEGVVTRLTLNKTTSSGGVIYSTLGMSWVKDLDDTGSARMREVAKEFRERIIGVDGFSNGS